MAKLTEYKKHEVTPFMSGKSSNIYIEHVIPNDEFMESVIKILSKMFGLNQRACKLMQYIQVAKSSGQVDMSPDKVMRHLGYSSKSISPIYSGIGQLVEAKVIAKSMTKHIYFVNPKYFPKGDGFTILHRYRKAIADRPEQADRQDEAMPLPGPVAPKGFKGKKKKA